MAVAGCSTSGKTGLNFKLLTGRTYYFEFKLVLYIYKDIQPICQEKLKARTSQIEFVSFD